MARFSAILFSMYYNAIFCHVKRCFPLSLGTLLLAGNVSANTGAASAAGTEYLTMEAAKQAALKQVGVAESDTRRMEIDFDYEHGMAVYEIEWKAGWTEYEYEINASTGKVVSYEVDY